MTTIANDCWDIAFLYWFCVNKNTKTFWCYKCLQNSINTNH